MEKAAQNFEDSLKLQVISNGETIAYRSQITSQDPKVNLILIHGWISSSLTTWDDFAALLNDLPINIYAVDLRGFGDSSFNKSILSMSDLAEDVNLFVKALGLKRVVVGGYSMGGAVTLRYAASYPGDLERLISFNGVGCQGIRTYYEQDGKQFQIVKSEDFGKSPFWGGAELKYSNNIAGALAFQEYAMFNAGKKIDPVKAEKNIRGGLLKERHVADAIYWLTHFNISKDNNGVVDGTGEIDKIKCKCLFIHTDSDVLLKAKDHGELTANILGKSQAKFVLVENSGHCPPMSNPEKTAEVVREFLKDML